MSQQELEGMPPAITFQGQAVDELRLAILGAGGLKLAENLRIGEPVELSVTGAVTAIRFVRREDKEDGEVVGYTLRQVVVVTADSAKVRGASHLMNDPTWLVREPPDTAEELLAK